MNTLHRSQRVRCLITRASGRHWPWWPTCARTGTKRTNIADGRQRERGRFYHNDGSDSSEIICTRARNCRTAQLAYEPCGFGVAEPTCDGAHHSLQQASSGSMTRWRRGASDLRRREEEAYLEEAYRPQEMLWALLGDSVLRRDQACSLWQ